MSKFWVLPVEVVVGTMTETGPGALIAPPAEIVAAVLTAPVLLLTANRIDPLCLRTSIFGSALTCAPVISKGKLGLMAGNE